MLEKIFIGVSIIVLSTFLIFVGKKGFDYVCEKQKQKKEKFYKVKRLSRGKYGVVDKKTKNIERFYERPTHDEPKKLAKMYARKLEDKRNQKVYIL